MENQIKSLEEVIQVLPLEIQEEVRDFIEFLLEKRVRRPKAELKPGTPSSSPHAQSGHTM